ncbi:MAG: hypothetical protein JWO31_3939 [Phycisphaerales bacterium]|nr:hypothetical protein [Phycisphaerales bacterium]
MARWRAEALAGLPGLRKAIESADSVMALWIDLWLAFEDAYRCDPPDEPVIAGIYAFADWCAGAPRNPDAGHDPLTAVVVAFYEHVPTCEPARADMPRWFRYADLASNPHVFGRLIDSRTYAALLRDVAAKERRSRRRAK